MPQVPARPGPDGVMRSVERETKLNALFLATFTTPAGAEVLKHLRHITIEAVAGPEITTDHLRHLEGRRYLVGIIEQRIKLGRQPLVDHQDQQSDHSPRRSSRVHGTGR